jgi:hypothetical protein
VLLAHASTDLSYIYIYIYKTSDTGMVMGRNTNMSCQHTPPCEGIFVYGGTEGISLVMYSFFSSLPW